MRLNIVRHDCVYIYISDTLIVYNQDRSDTTNPVVTLQAHKCEPGLGVFFFDCPFIDL